MKSKIAITFVLLLFACQAPPNVHEQAIRIETNPAGSRCVLSNNLGQWEVSNTPETVIVKRSRSALNIACTHPGYLPLTATVEAARRHENVREKIEDGSLSILDLDAGALHEYINPSLIFQLNAKGLQ